MAFSYIHGTSSLVLALLPKTSIVKSGDREREVTLPVTGIFNARECDYNNKSFLGYGVNPKYYVFRFLQNLRSSFSIDSLLHRIITKNIDKEFIDNFHAELLNSIPEFEHRLDLLKRAVAASPKNIVDGSFPESFVSNPFPLVFVCENDDKMELVGATEYRAKINLKLKLGEDIQVVATDSLAHKEELQAYFSKHKLEMTIMTLTPGDIVNNLLII